eukprot:163113-Hanusia_phi.AAC.3
MNQCPACHSEAVSGTPESGESELSRARPGPGRNSARGSPGAAAAGRPASSRLQCDRYGPIAPKSGSIIKSGTRRDT